MFFEKRYNLEFVILAVISFVIATAIYSGFLFLHHSNIDQQRLKDASYSIAHTINLVLAEKVNVVRTLADMPDLSLELKSSNAAYDDLPLQKRHNLIDELNRQWMSTSSENAPFVKARIESLAGQLLTHHREANPNQYGEIFLTNAHGVVIGSTGRLSTLAHAHKYWWKEAYAHGAGKIFIDDRGYDDSVGDIVVGVVVPIIEDGAVLGILKANLLIKGSLYQILRDTPPGLRDSASIVRSRGLVIARMGSEPLSESLLAEELAFVDLSRTNSTSYTPPTHMPIDRVLIASSPVPLTQGGNDIGFGGKPESIDHRLGNKSEFWAVVIKSPLKLVDLLVDTIMAYAFIMVIMLGSIWALYRFSVHSVYTPLENLSLLVMRKEDKDSEVLDKSRSIKAVFERLDSEIILRKKAEEEISRLALYDQLTGLANRHSFNQRFSEHLKLARRENRRLALMILDLDKFKPVNDTYGHQVGDAVLKRVAEIFRQFSRETDTVARLGGDEFAIILVHPEDKAAAQVSAQRLVNEISKPFIIEGHDIHIGVSIGLYLFPDDAENEETLIRYADMALYEAKKKGRNTYHFFEQELAETGP